MRGGLFYRRKHGPRKSLSGILRRLNRLCPRGRLTPFKLVEDRLEWFSHYIRQHV